MIVGCRIKQLVLPLTLDRQYSFDNFINTSRYKNALLKEQISLFIEYLKVFHNYHNKYLTRFNLKVKLMYGQIQADIKLEESKMPKYDAHDYTSTYQNMNINGENNIN